MKKKILTAIFAALTATVCVYSFTACNVTPGTTNTPPAGSEEEEQKEEEKPSTPALTFDGFIKDHKTGAVKFFEDFIYNGVVGDREVKAESWYLNDADGDNKVESAAMCYIYSINETERAVEVATVTFTPIGVQDIVDGKVTSVSTTVSRETKMTFDAKEEEKQTQAATLLSETVLGGSIIKSTTYTLEKFEEEKPPVTPDPPEEEPVTNAEIIAALEENCINDIVSATRLGSDKQNKDNIVDGIWYLTKDSGGKATTAEYVYTYQKSNTNVYYVITEVKFEAATSLKDIKDGNFNATYKNVYKNANYNPTIQDSNAELTQAICDKAFGESANAIKYIIDGSGGTDSELKEVHYFTVIQIENGNIREASITIKDDSAGYVANVNNGNHKDITYGKSYQISGEEIKIS